LALLVVALVTIRDRLTRFRIVLPLAAVAVMGVGLLAVGGTGGRDISADDESAQGRIDAWRAGIQMLKERPFTGVGYGRFADHNGGLAAHNSLVNCFAEQGFFGYICWIALLYVLFRRLTKLRESSDPEGDSGDIYRWANALRASLLGCMTAAFFLSRTYAPTVYMVFAVIMALYATSQSRDEPPDAEIGPIFAPATGVALCSIIGIYVLVRVV
jgi:O-antigen ligase